MRSFLKKGKGKKQIQTQKSKAERKIIIKSKEEGKSWPVLDLYTHLIQTQPKLL